MQVLNRRKINLVQSVSVSVVSVWLLTCWSFCRFRLELFHISGYPLVLLYEAGPRCCTLFLHATANHSDNRRIWQKLLYNLDVAKNRDRLPRLEVGDLLLQRFFSRPGGDATSRTTGKMWSTRCACSSGILTMQASTAALHL